MCVPRQAKELMRVSKGLAYLFFGERKKEKTLALQPKKKITKHSNKLISLSPCISIFVKKKCQYVLHCQLGQI
jgi:hypothetical protein